MNKNLLILVSLIAGQAMAMEPGELTLLSEQSVPTNTAEKMVTIQLQGGETRELPSRYISVSVTLKNLVDDLSEAHKEAIPLPQVSLAPWQLIENQLERVYRSTHGETQLRDEIIAEYTQLANRSLIGLIGAVEYLDIPLLKEITLELAQNKLTSDEILMLSTFMRNEVIKRKALKIAGPVIIKKTVKHSFDYDLPFSCYVTSENEISVVYNTVLIIFDTSGNKLRSISVRYEDDAEDEDDVEEWAIASSCVLPNNRIVTGFYQGPMRIWDFYGNVLAAWEGHADEVSSVCFTEGNKIVSGSADGTVGIWDMDGNKLAFFQGHEDGVLSVWVTSDHKIVSGSRDGTVGIWDMNGNRLAFFQGHIDLPLLERYYFQLGPVYVTRDNKIVSWFGNKTLQIWDFDGNELAACRGHEDAIFSVCVTQDNRIVSASKDQTVRIWDTQGNELAVCRGHEGPIISVCVTRDNKIVSGSLEDQTVRIWDIFGRPLAICLGLDGRYCDGDVNGLVWATQDNKIVGCEQLGMLIWDMSDVSLYDRLSNMSKTQAMEIDKVLEKTKGLQHFLARVIIEKKEPELRILKRGIFKANADAWAEIVSIFNKEELDVELKKRKETVSDESNPVKKIRVSQELGAENKE